MNALQLVSHAALIYIPALAANMAPVFVHRFNLFPWLYKPMDFGISIGGKRVLGPHKTIRGIVGGIIAGAGVGVAMYLVVQEYPYNSMSKAIVYGAAVGLGALMGDAVKSFWKRRFDISPGTMWVPFDQIDFVIGATIAALFFNPVSLEVFLFSTVLIGVCSYLVSLLGVALHMKAAL